MNTATLNNGADNIRVLAASMVEKARSGHPGGAMGGADFINVLYSSFIVTDPDNPHWIARDRFFLDPGHMSPMLYAVLALAGKYQISDLQQFRQWGSITPGHPEVDVEHGVENTSGPLGQGHTMAVGAAIAERFLQARFGDIVAHYTYAFISDGGIQEEISQGAGRIAGYLGLGRLIMFYDSNRVQLSTDVDAVDREDYAAKYRAWGWHVIEIDGTDPIAIADAIQQAQANTQQPSLIIGNTIMGRGCVTKDGQSFENQCSTHGQPLSKSGADYDATMRNLGADPADPWQIRPDVAQLYSQRNQQLRAIVAQWHDQYNQWAQQNPDKAQLLDTFFSGRAPEVDLSAIIHKANIATRAASANVLAALAQQVPNMIVSSADLANSDKTDAFLKKTHALTHGDFSGAFLHAGVAELTMAAIMNGIALHGGMIAACGTFFVFSDYMKPAVRMAALMRLPVKYIWTHDAFRVGEDGPTHQPIEQEAQIRLMEMVYNHKGQPSMLVLRPADAAETTVAWQMAMENTDTPTGLIFSRQDVIDLPGNRAVAAQGTRRGAYVVIDAPDAQVTLIANGSEAGLACQTAELLLAEGIRARVVSIPSIGLFNTQDAEYRNAVLQPNTPMFALTAGLPQTMRLIDGFHGTVFGLNHFGESAPYTVLDQKFGFTPQNILNAVKESLGIAPQARNTAL